MSYSKQNFRSGDTLYASQLNAMDDEIAVLEAEVESTKNMVGSPLTASTAAGMTDQTKIYVYTGSETGYTAGHWYYYNGTAWTDGGVYNSVAVNTDTSLTVSGQAADSKAVGDAIDDLDSDLTDLKSDLSETTRNLVEGIIPHANIRSDGVLAVDPSLEYDMAFCRISYGNTYAVSIESGALLYGFFSDVPKSGDSAIGGRHTDSVGAYLVTVTDQTATYLAVRLPNNGRIQIEEGTSKTDYVPHISATDFVARAAIASAEADIGLISELSTENDNDLVSAINEINAQTNINTSDIGKFDRALSDVITPTRNLVSGVISDATMPSSGKISASGGEFDLVYCPVEYGKTYSATWGSGSLVYGFFDSVPSVGVTALDGRHVVSDSYSFTVNVQNATYVAVRIPINTTTAQIEEGSARTAYIQPISANDAVARESVTAVNADIAAIDERVTALEPESYTITIEPDMVKEGYYINENGLFRPFNNTSDMAYYASDYIPLDGSKVISFVTKITTIGDITSVAFYDANKVFVSRVSGDATIYNTDVSVTVPSEARYVAYTRVVTPSKTASPFSTVVTTDSGEETDVPLAEIIKDGGYTNIFHHIGVIGDSLSSGYIVGRDSQNVQHTENNHAYSWGKCIERMCGNSVHIFARGGMTTREWLTMWGTTGTTYATDFETNLCQAYIIALSQNDGYQHYVPVGTSADINTTTPSSSADTFYGNYYRIIARIKEVQPRARIFVVTNPYPRYSLDDGYNEAVRYMAETFENVYLIDLKEYAPTLYVDSDLWYSDHFTAYGYQMGAYIMSSYIDWIIRHNESEFRDVQWIGTDYWLT